VAALLVGATSAAAAEVSVLEVAGEPNTAELDYTAAPGENNQLAITIAGNDGAWQLDVTDPGAAIMPGSHCTGGGAVGTPVRCRMHEPREWATELCGKMCVRRIPGTAWSDTMRIVLGDGDNSFDGGAFAGTYALGVEMTVTSGAGDDTIATGGGEDLIDPGAGSDTVKGGEGFDEFIATPEPDGPDVYESGPITIARIDYSARTTPVEVHGTSAGAAGEGDTLVGGFVVVGGSGDDVLEGGPEDTWLAGGPGDDVLAGNATRGNNLYAGPGDDVLAANGETNHLVGEEGDDTYYGGAGLDIIRDGEQHQLPAILQVSVPALEGGADVAHGGGGNDAIGLGVGDDQIYGGSGDDRLDGESGKDTVGGGEGGDRLIGGYGFDRLSGGPGSDTLFSGRWHWKANSAEFPFSATRDDGADQVGCGSGRDTAVSNPWDTVRNCETVRLVRKK
jgi:Ca2+-binding RTX toxin-like protein